MPGLGSTRSAWEEQHQADPRYTPGSVYDNGKYYAAIWIEEQLHSVSIRLNSHTPVQTARAEVELLLPPDREIAWSKIQVDCYLIQWRSKLLAKRYPASQGSAFAAFQSGPSRPYRATDVQDVYIEAYPNSPDDFPNC